MASDSERRVSIPAEFFSEVLPEVDDLGLLKLLLYAFWARSTRDSESNGLRVDDLIQDQRWLDGIEAKGTSRAEAARELLERAVHKGMLLATGDGVEATFYFINDELGRRRLKAAEEEGLKVDPDRQAPSLQGARPNLFVLYEQNIGPITPILAERLREAEREFPPHWIEEAVTIAVTNNVRKWRYIEAILDDWKTKGRDEREDQGDPAQARRRYVEGRFKDFIEH